MLQPRPTLSLPVFGGARNKALPAGSAGVSSTGVNNLTIGRLAICSLPLVAAIVFSMTVRIVTLDLALSFIILGLALSIQFLLAVGGRSDSPANASVFVFGLMFLLVAPIVQISVLGFKLVNTTYANADLVITTNIACSLFIGAYLAVRALLGELPEPVRAEQESATSMKLFVLTAMLLVSAFITLFSLPFMGADAENRSLAPVVLAFRKFVFFIPTALFLITLSDYQRREGKRTFMHIVLFVALFVCVLATQNYLTEKRNGLGPVYLAVLFLVFRRWLGSSAVQVFWLMVVLLVLFPLSSLLTHSNPFAPAHDFDPFGVVADHFLTTHYDAWANIYSSIEMVGRKGASNGKQLLGALVFYVPSQWWSGKPLATGIEIGNYLVDFHSMWFTNLSAPLIAEAFIDFSFAGVVFYGAAMAVIVRGVEKMSGSDRGASAQAYATYMAFFLVFLLRGSLMVAVAYGSGATVAFLFSRMLLRLVKAVAPQTKKKRLPAGYAGETPNRAVSAVTR